jgi:hypothetical protein
LEAIFSIIQVLRGMYPLVIWEFAKNHSWWFTYQTWWLSIAMLNCQRAYTMMIHDKPQIGDEVLSCVPHQMAVRKQKNGVPPRAFKSARSYAKFISEKHQRSKLLYEQKLFVKIFGQLRTSTSSTLQIWYEDHGQYSLYGWWSSHP